MRALRTSGLRTGPQPVVARWPTWLWGSEQMRHVLARRELGAVVAMFRAAAQLSQQELAELTGWSQSAVSLVETGRRDTLYDIRELLKFADAVAMPARRCCPCCSAALHASFAGDLPADLAAFMADSQVPLGRGRPRRASQRARLADQTKLVSGHHR